MSGKYKRYKNWRNKNETLVLLDEFNLAIGILLPSRLTVLFYDSLFQIALAPNTTSKMFHRNFDKTCWSAHFSSSSHQSSVHMDNFSN